MKCPRSKKDIIKPECNVLREDEKGKGEKKTKRKGGLYKIIFINKYIIVYPS